MKTITLFYQRNLLNLDKSLLFYSCSFLAMILVLSTSLKAQTNLLYTPEKIVFDGSKNTQDIYLTNTSVDTVEYRVSIIHLRLNEDGSFVEIQKPDSGMYFADNFISFYPKDFKLNPGESISIKVKEINSDKIVNAEYRSHLYFYPITTQKHNPALGFTIPVIIRNSKIDSDVGLMDVKFKWQYDTIPSVNFNFNRSGEYSVFGDVAVYYIAMNGKETLVGTVKNVSVYAPLERRNCNLFLKRSTGINYHLGKLKIQYIRHNDENLQTIAEAGLMLK